jgi:hypothetical protein
MPSRTTTHTYPTGLIECAHRFSSAVYDPVGQGAIVSLSYSYDLAHYTSLAVNYSILVFQDGTYYHHVPENSIVGSSWTHFTNTNPLTDASFTKLYGQSQNVHPDFTCTGTPIVFGYVTRNSNPNAGTTDTTRSGIDNWTVTITPRPCQKQSTSTYAAKFVCGVQPDDNIKSMPDAQPGRYSTKINVHNNTGNQIRFRKKIIPLSGGQVPTDPKFKKLEALTEDQAMEVVCKDIYSHLNIPIKKSIPPYIEGFVILEVYYYPSFEKPSPPDPLDVVGIYTYKGDLPLGAAPKGSGVSIEVVVYPAKNNSHILN